MTSLYIPSSRAVLGEPAGGAATAGAAVADLVTLMDTLRERCPWDRVQTHASLMPHLVEECYEVLDALAALDAVLVPSEGAVLNERGEGAGGRDLAAAYAHLQEELGDLLFQIVFHARLADEGGAFELADVARTVHDKLVHRHPHVFGDVAAERREQVEQNWEDIKKSEKGRQSVTEGIPAALPALMLTTKLARKARSVGFDPASKADGSVAADLASLAARAARNDPHARRSVVQRGRRGCPPGGRRAVRGRDPCAARRAWTQNKRYAAAP